jgi:hypothetical protein
MQSVTILEKKRKKRRRRRRNRGTKKGDGQIRKLKGGAAANLAMYPTCTQKTRLVQISGGPPNFKRNLR